MSLTSQEKLGIILCGGESTRMGRDKGLLTVGDTRWAEIIRRKFNECQLLSIVSLNAAQVPSYSALFDQKELVVDDSTLKIRGPLLGILSVHLNFPDKDLVVVACDMINMNSIVIQDLLDEFLSQNVEAIAYKGEKIEPLCAIYSAQGLRKILNSYQKGQLQKFSMTLVLEMLNTTYVPIKDDWKSYFKNLNTPDDIKN